MNKEELRLDFLFIGPQRTGTTWLYDHLINHPSLCFPKGVKETMFFDCNYEKGLDWYQWHFSECKEEYIRGEVAPTYFDNSKAPARVYKHFPDCKIIISLRDPIERAKSLYQHHYQKGRVAGTFSEAIKVKPSILTSGYYADHIKRWHEYFNKNQILLITLKEIRNYPGSVLEKICKFINVEEEVLSKEIKTQKINTALQPRYHLLAKLVSSLVTRLHSYRLHGIVNLAKKIGLKKMFFKESDDKPQLTKKEREFLKKQLASHITYVNENFDNVHL